MNVQVIAQEAPHIERGYGFTHTKDAYCWRDDGGWFGMDSLGLHFYLAEAGTAKYCIFGQTMAWRKDFDACLRRAVDEGLG